MAASIFELLPFDGPVGGAAAFQLRHQLVGLLQFVADLISRTLLVGGTRCLGLLNGLIELRVALQLGLKTNVWQTYGRMVSKKGKSAQPRSQPQGRK